VRAAWARSRFGLRSATALLVVLLAGGCSHQSRPGGATDQVLTKSAPATATPTAVPAPSTATPEYPAYAATAISPHVAVHGAADPDSSTQRLDNPRPSGAPLTFLLVDPTAVSQGDWLQVYLPVRSNGSTGWVNRSDVRLAGVTYRIEISRSGHQLRLYDRAELVKELPVGVGTGKTPTPIGQFYLTELLELPDPAGAYGPYAYGLSGFSDVLTEFAGGDGIIGLHGTNEPEAVGTDVSHGCIRLRNDDITALTTMLPLGTPVQISA
jgi:lipoprotein-anchoring transpeptidase ErfK/SrfK